MVKRRIVENEEEKNTEVDMKEDMDKHGIKMDIKEVKSKIRSLDVDYFLNKIIKVNIEHEAIR
jgi:hypothetical protein